MKPVSSILTVLLWPIITFGQSGAVPRAPQPSQPTSVNVVNQPSVIVGNGASAPVPVTGTVNVGAMPALTIAGTPTVAASIPPVVSASEQAAFVLSLTSYIADGSQDTGQIPTPNIPAGKRLVLEALNVFMYPLTAPAPWVTIDTSVIDSATQLRRPLRFFVWVGDCRTIGTQGLWCAVNTPIRAFVDGSDYYGTLSVSIARGDTVGGVYIKGHLTGHLVDCSSPACTAMAQ